jgi:hypothetical protein
MYPQHLRNADTSHAPPSAWPSVKQDHADNGRVPSACQWTFKGGALGRAAPAAVSTVREAVAPEIGHQTGRGHGAGRGGAAGIPGSVVSGNVSPDRAAGARCAGAWQPGQRHAVGGSTLAAGQGGMTAGAGTILLPPWNRDQAEPELVPAGPASDQPQKMQHTSGRSRQVQQVRPQHLWACGLQVAECPSAGFDCSGSTDGYLSDYVALIP